jgi:putative zinc finger/helix-turn-helix YgiT family protein
MRCSHCKKGTAKIQNTPYHFTECGLPDVYLINVKWTICMECKEATVEIPRMGQLHRCLAWLVVLKNSFLTGQEIVYLRKMLGRTQRDMASLLGIGEGVLNRMERGKRTGRSKAMDSYIRLAYVQLQDDEYTHDLREALLKYLGHIKSDAAPLQAKIDSKLCRTQDIVETALASLIPGTPKPGSGMDCCT